MSYTRYELPPTPAPADLKQVADDYRAIICGVIRSIVERYQRTPDYPFIDTKLNLITGEDFDDEDPIRGRGAVYGWIQGRGLESLVGHARFLKSDAQNNHLVAELDEMIEQITAQLQIMRSRNGGHLSFLMDPEGHPFHLTSDGRPLHFSINDETPYGFSDLFASKGLFAAATYAENDAALSDALHYVEFVEKAIWQESFQSDQIPLDPKLRPEPRDGFRAHGAYMIQIGTLAMLAEAGISGAVERGLRLIEYELATYTNLDGRVADLQEGDFWEGVNAQGAPYREADGVLYSDPGHALEFVGLSLKFIAAAQARATPDQTERLRAAQRPMTTLLERNFANGYIADPGGISKAFDLVSRRHLNTDMPWWNLPETIRSAAFALHAATSSAERTRCLRVLRDAHNAFRHFVRPDLHLMAYQTRSIQGQPVDAIPATADADPGYHTGLSLIDTIQVLEEL
tara:strand:+ start:3532 stop:4902 length:1371 start_codon:yes stop_codon:yes gene_type:complete